MEDKKAVDARPFFRVVNFCFNSRGSLVNGHGPRRPQRCLGRGLRRPEKKEVRIGFIPLTDCASVVMAAVMKFDEKYGIKIIPTKEASWASVRDKLVNGELDAATCCTA